MVKRRILLLKLKRAFLECVSPIKLTAINCYVESVNMAFLRVSVSGLMADGPHFTYFPTPISFLERERYPCPAERTTGTTGTILFRPRKGHWRLKAMKLLNFFSYN